MHIIDRYLLRQFLQTFVICYLSLAGLYIVFDAFTHLEEFFNCAEKTGGLFSLMGSYYSYRAILFFDRSSGLLTLVAAMFTVSWIQRHNELTALQAAGISRLRVAAPIIVAAAVIALLSAANRELVIPQCRDELVRRPANLLGQYGEELHAVYDQQTSVLFRGKATYADQQRIESPDFLMPDALNQYGPRLVAENAFYRPPEGERPGGYLLEGVQEPSGLADRPSLRLVAQPVLITPRDAPDWLRNEQAFLVSEMTFEQLTGGRALRQFSSTAQMIAGLWSRSLDFGADVRVAIHTRLINPLLDLTLLFLGLPLVLSRRSQNVFVAIGLCVGIVAVYLLVIIACQHFGSIYLIDPALAAWLPLMIFVPPAVGMSEMMWR
ncbi:MAG TPA: LptF/LptG family permease [Thermoguttaceae bacterium]|nr:LptF/LptG family permease [Thermoguttaceae bacterium]